MKLINFLLITILMLNVSIFSNPTKPLFISSIPKSGTHLLARIIEEITHKSEVWGNKLTAVNDIEINNALSPQKYYMTHAVHVPFNVNKIKNKNFKTIFLMRDPRDVLVSYAYWVKKDFHNILGPKNQQQAQLPISSIIAQFIEKYPCTGLHVPPYRTIVGFYHLYLPWKNYPNAFVTSFERLIGEHGGGNKEIQENEIVRLSQFLGRPLNQAQVQNLCQKLFGGTKTFREGQIGGWKKHLTEGHKKALKSLPGFNELLINLGYEKDANW